MVELDKFKQVVEVKGSAARDTDTVNRYLLAGWKLFATRTVRPAEPELVSESTVYCLGWDQPVQPPIEAGGMTVEQIHAELRRRREYRKELMAEVWSKPDGEQPPST